MRCAALAVLFACSEAVRPSFDVDGPPPNELTSTGLIDSADGRARYADEVVPYSLRTPLFSDYAHKDRAMFVPSGQVAYSPDALLDLPVGTVLLKTFSFPADLRAPDRDVRLVETRVLARTADGWVAWPYLWNEEQTEATLAPAGEVLSIDFLDVHGEPRTASYLVPQRNQCQACHERQGDGDETFITPLGPVARNMSQESLERLSADGVLTGLPNADAVPRATDFERIEQDGVDGLSAEQIEVAARDYLDVNCGSCHNERGVQGITSQLFLDLTNTDRFHLGVCKRPGSAGEGTGGLDYDIVPGRPDESILLFRVETTEPGAMMPLLGRSLTHARGAELLRAWIAQMPEQTCD